MKKPNLSHVASVSAVTAIALLALRGSAFAGGIVAPEIDPGTAVSGLALLAGGALLLIERLRRR